VKRYRGPLAVSVVLTLLFGLLHLTPLRGDERAKA
jgi:membrane protease YdiL (CAAX protease family)